MSLFPKITIHQISQKESKQIKERYNLVQSMKSRDTATVFVMWEVKLLLMDEHQGSLVQIFFQQLQIGLIDLEITKYYQLAVNKKFMKLSYLTINVLS